jgi:hypothetical protein
LKEKYDQTFHAKQRKNLTTVSHMVHVIPSVHTEKYYKSNNFLVHFQDQPESGKKNSNTCSNQITVVTSAPTSNVFSLSFVLQTLIHHPIPFFYTTILHTLNSSNVEHWNHVIYKTVTNFTQLFYEKQKADESNLLKSGKNCRSMLDKHYNTQNHQFVSIQTI